MSLPFDFQSDLPVHGRVPVDALGKGGVVYEAEAVALFARMTVQPDSARKGVINTLIKSLKTAGVWSKFTALWVMAAHDNQAGRRNWIADLYNAAAVAGPNFLADRGYQGDASSSYLTTGLTAAGTLNDNHIGSWSLTDAASTSAVDIGKSNLFIFPRTAANLAATKNNASPTDTVAVPNSSGHIVISRSGSASYSRFKDGASLGDVTATTTSADAQPLAIGARGTGAGAADNFSSRRIAIAHAGTGLTLQNEIDMRAAFLIYLQAVGAV